MQNINPVEIWDASPFLAVLVFACVLFWVARRYPEKSDDKPNKADDLFAQNNELFRSVVSDMREIKAILSDIRVELIRNTNRRD